MGKSVRAMAWVSTRTHLRHKPRLRLSLMADRISWTPNELHFLVLLASVFFCHILLFYPSFYWQRLFIIYLNLPFHQVFQGTYHRASRFFANSFKFPDRFFLALTRYYLFFSVPFQICTLRFFPVQYEGVFYIYISVGTSIVACVFLFMIYTYIYCPSNANHLLFGIFELVFSYLLIFERYSCLSGFFIVSISLLHHFIFVSTCPYTFILIEYSNDSLVRFSRASIISLLFLVRFPLASNLCHNLTNL